MAGTSRKELLTRMMDELRENKRENLIGWHMYNPIGKGISYCFIGCYSMCLLNDSYGFWDAKEMKTTRQINGFLANKRSDGGENLLKFDGSFTDNKLDMELLKQFIKINGGRRAYKKGCNTGTAWKFGDAWYNPIYLYDMACMICGSQKKECYVYLLPNNSLSGAWFYNDKNEVGMVLPLHHK